MLADLERNDLLNGNSPEAVLSRIVAENDLAKALEGAVHIQENTPENLETKIKVFSLLDEAADPSAVIASSTSALLPSKFTEHLKNRQRCLVVHPINPPYLIPAAEVVPAPWTSSEVVERTRAFLIAAGHAPMVMKRELDGFIMNRMQGALLEEAFRLVADGYATVEDVDIGIRDGLALRWSFMGPFETIDLNAPGGVRDYVERYQIIYERSVSADAAPRRLGRRSAGNGRGRPPRKAAAGEAGRSSGLARPPPHGACGAQEEINAGVRTMSETTRVTSGSSTKGKVIITCAITGAIHTPTMSPYLPITPDEIAKEALAAAEAGAAILHLHARDPETGKPDQTPEAFAKFLPRIKQNTNAAINITTGGSPYMKVEERVKPAATFKPEVASLNMGSINFGLYHLVDKYKEFKFDWEKPHLEATRDLVFRNSFKDIEYILATCYDNGTRFEFECYDIAHLYNLAHFADRGLVKPPFFVQSVFGLLGAIGTHPEDVAHMKRTADRLFGDRLPLVGSRRRIQPACALPLRRRRWAATSGLASKTVCGQARASWPKSNAEQVAAGAQDHRRAWHGSGDAR